MKLATLEVDTVPVEPAQFRGEQASKDRRQQQRTPACGVGDVSECGDDGAHLIRRGDVDADLELAVALPSGDLRILTTTATASTRVHHVLPDQSALLRVGQQ